MRAKLIWIGLFSIAMACLEAAVVVYLWELYYPEGFSFPLKLIPIKIALIELGREASTIVMLAAVGFISGRVFLERFSYFLYAFGLWDIFYYIWLKVFLDWPPSLMTWDVLFLIPVPWTAPVLAPILISSSLVAAAVTTLSFESRGHHLRPTVRDWTVAAIAIIILFISFIWDCPNILRQGMPTRYHWELFIIGQALWIGIFLLILKRAYFRTSP